MTLRRSGALSQADLGRAIGMQPANVHGLVARLQKMQMIEATPHPTDQRQVRVALSSTGEHHATTIAAASAASAETTLATLSPEERQVFLALLSRIAT